VYPPRVNVRSLAGLSVAMLASASLVASCGARSEPPEDRYAGEIASTDTPRGRSRYQVVCAPCHERRTSLNAPTLSGLGWTAPRVRRQIREGTALMPPIRAARLSDDDMEALLAYFVDMGTVVEELEVHAPTHAVPRRSEPDAGWDAGVDAPVRVMDPWDIVPDDGAPDAGAPDTGAPDTGAPDAGTPDAGTPDAGPSDADAPGRGRSLASPRASED
jgi:mono/diheme cytochrome c family protein